MTAGLNLFQRPLHPGRTKAGKPRDLRSQAGARVTQGIARGNRCFMITMKFGLFCELNQARYMSVLLYPA